MTIKAVFFDLDGTLLDTHQDLAVALNKLREERNLPALPVGEIREHVSNGASALIRLGFGVGSEDAKFGELRERLLALYIEDIAAHTQPFEGMHELINTLSQNQLHWGVVTNKPRLYTRALLEKVTFDTPPAVVVSPDDVGIAKPDPRPLTYACEQIGCRPEQAIYVGDHLRDIEAGKNAGMATIAVGFGFTQDTNEYLTWQADYTAKSAHDIWPAIEQHMQN